jgi:hypothetical protein
MTSEEIVDVGAALRTINQASYDVLASFTLELYEANHAISGALLSKIPARSKSSTTTGNDKRFQPQNQGEVQDALHTSVWYCRPETALMNLAEYWLHERAMGSESNGARSGIPLTLRKAIISNSPAVIALLRKAFIKRKRLTKYE